MLFTGIDQYQTEPQEEASTIRLQSLNGMILIISMADIYPSCFTGNPLETNSRTVPNSLQKLVIQAWTGGSGALLASWNVAVNKT